MFDKSFTDMLTALATAAAALAALGTLLYGMRQYWRDRRRQQAALTRVDLQAIVEDCSQFLRPLSQTYPYPILHTSTAITQQFCSYLGEPREWKDIKALFDDKRLLRSI